MTVDRERNYRVEAIVIGRREFREADRIVMLFSREHGKLHAIAKGARKPNARSGPALEYFSRGRYMLARGRGDLDVVTSAELVDRPVHLEGDLARLAYASHVAELTGRLAQEGQTLPALYDLLSWALGALGTMVTDQAVVRGFEVMALDQAGYRMGLWNCSNCQADLAAEINFLGLQSGGLLCGNCRSSDGGRTLAVSLNAQKYLRLLMREGIGSACRVELASSLATELERLMSAYISTVLERDLTSLRVLQEIRESSPEFRI